LDYLVQELMVLLDLPTVFVVFMVRAAVAELMETQVVLDHMVVAVAEHSAADGVRPQVVVL
jgi:hypothetical protein